MRQLYTESDTPAQEFYIELCNKFGQEIVDYTQRCFYLKSWRKVHGRYPIKLDYMRMKCIMAVEEELSLFKAYQGYKMHVQSEKMKMDAQVRASKGGRSAPTSKIPINRF